MATVPNMIDAFMANFAGLKRANLTYRAQILREAGYLPTGKRGGGRFAAHVNAGHCANFLLGFVAPDAVNAAKVVKACRALKLTEFVEHDLPKFKGGPIDSNRTLAAELTWLIETYGAGLRPAEGRAEVAAIQIWREAPHRALIELSVAPQADGDFGGQVYKFEPRRKAQQKREAFEYPVLFQGRVIEVFGELLRETEPVIEATKSLTKDKADR